MPCMQEGCLTKSSPSLWLHVSLVLAHVLFGCFPTWFSCPTYMLQAAV